MIDETYVEFAPDVSEITAMPLAAAYDNLMILRVSSSYVARLVWAMVSQATRLSLLH